MSMEIKTTLGFSVEVDDMGGFELPMRRYTSAELKKIAREVNRNIRLSNSKDEISEVLMEYE